MENIGMSENRADEDGNRKRKKFFGDERLHRNRERNRMHARKTRERKKQQSNALQTRLRELEDEGKKLRQIVDDRYTASVLLGLSQTFRNSLGENLNILSSANICNNASTSTVNGLFDSSGQNMSHGNAINQSGLQIVAIANLTENGGGNLDNNVGQNVTIKRVRRRGKYTPQERERIRRERNRMHAKRTRDRKKKLLEDSETIIVRMEKESHLLRGYCVSLNMISMEDATRFEERASESKRELAALKASQGEYDVDCDEDDDNEFNHNDEDGDGDDEHDNDGSLSGSDDNEKSCSWSGSNNGNEYSMNGDTSGDASSSTSKSSNKNDNNNSGNDSRNSGSSNSSHSHSSGSGSGSGGDSPVPKHASSDWKDEKSFNYGTKPPNVYSAKPLHPHPSSAYPAHTHSSHLGMHSTYAPSHVHTHNASASLPRCDMATASQSVESYNHGGVPWDNTGRAPHTQHTVPSSDIPAPAPIMVLSVLEIKATLAAADYFKNQNQIPTPPQPWVYPPLSRPIPIQLEHDTYSLSISPHQQSGAPYVKKVKNILLSVIPAGVSAPYGAGAISPQGAFSPIPSFQNSQVTYRRHPALDRHVDITNYHHTPGAALEYRNLPSSNIVNAHEPL